MAIRTDQEARARREAKLDALHNRLASAVSGLITGQGRMPEPFPTLVAGFQQ